MSHMNYDSTKKRNSGLIVTLLLFSILLSIAPTSASTERVDYNASVNFELGERITPGNGAKVACSSPQNDAGTGGDVGNSALTGNYLGTDVTLSTTGCIDDVSDWADFYEIDVSANKDVSVELTVPIGSDFDLYIKDSTNTTFVDASEYNDPLESVFFMSGNTSGNYFVWVNWWTGDGTYGLDIWTNSSSPKSDLTVDSVVGPSTANQGSTVQIDFTVNNIGPAATNSSYDIPIILSTDTIYDSLDTLLNVQIQGPTLSSGASQNMSEFVTIPTTLTSGNYYWIVWADGWGNLTEEDELNNNDYSILATSIGNVTPQNDGGSGADFPNNATNTINYIFTGSIVLTGEIGGSDTDDWLRVSHNSNEGVAASLSFDSANDFDFFMYDNTSTNLVDDSTGMSVPEEVSTNGTSYTGTMVYLRISAWSGSGNWTLTIWKFSNSTTSSPTLSLTMPDKYNAEAAVTGLTVGNSYSLEVTLYDYPLDIPPPPGQSWGSYPSSNSTLTTLNWIAQSSTFYYNYSFMTTDAEGEYFVIGMLYENGLFSSLDLDVIYHNVLDGFALNDTSGKILIENLTSTSGYTVIWEVYDNVTGISHEIGIDTLTTNISYLIVDWNYTVTLNEHLFQAIILDSSGMVVGGFSEPFQPMNLPDADGDGWPDVSDDCPNTWGDSWADLLGCPDMDGDGWSDYNDAFPMDPFEWFDSDMDGYGDNSDAFPMDPTEWMDSDGDGYGDNYADAFPMDPTEWMDSDGDGFGDNSDAFPMDPSEWLDSDGDGYGDNSDDCPNTWGDSYVDQEGCPDSDGDGWSDYNDAFPIDPTEWLDSDMDGYGDNSDAFPMDPYEWIDSDGDGYGDNSDDCPNTWGDSWADLVGCPDTDYDGWSDVGDAFPMDSTEWIDTDGDGYGDNYADEFPMDSTEWIDADGDGYGDNYADAFPLDPNEWMDSDGDGYGDNSDDCPSLAGTSYIDLIGCSDGDGDGYSGFGDAFPFDPTEWADMDGDGVGDNSDTFPTDPNEWMDSDGDGVGDNGDAFHNDATQWEDSDGDGYGDNQDGNQPDHCPQTPEGENVDATGCSDSERDSDNDGIFDSDDNCQFTNASDWDNDQDGCIDDTDGDGLLDPEDNCRNENSSQWDNDQDGCIDDTDGDMIKDDQDQCVIQDSTGFDSDGDGCIDDTDNDNIPDGVDDCQYSDATGFDSDGDGCIDDSDGDQIKDNNDDCKMESSTGFDSDGDGCIDDSDGDQIKDNNDDCDRTPANEIVDNDGCSESQLDDDNDDVMNDADQCSDTPENEEVDINGCTESQLDDDNDGAMNDVDQCKDTSANEEVDAKGCAESQLDGDNDGVMNDVDQCKDTSANEEVDANGCSQQAQSTNVESTGEEGLSLGLISVVGLLLIGLIAGGIMFLTKNKETEDELKSFEMEAETMLAYANQEAQPALQEPEQWKDDDGVHWNRTAEGDLYMWDHEANEWQKYG